MGMDFRFECVQSSDCLSLSGLESEVHMSQQQQTPKEKLKARLLLVDSHVVVRQGIAALINQEPDLLVCGGVSATPAALDSIPNLKPDLVLSDITLKNGNGL